MPTRRAMLQGLIGAALLGGLLTTPVPAVAGDPRYHAIIAQAQRLIALGHADAATTDRALRAEITALTDQLLGTMLDQFDGPIDPAQMQAVFAPRDGSLWSDHELAACADAVVPVSVMRELIHVHHLWFRPGQCGHWPRFAARYQDAIQRA